MNKYRIYFWVTYSFERLKLLFCHTTCHTYLKWKLYYPTRPRWKRSCECYVDRLDFIYTTHRHTIYFLNSCKVLSNVATSNHTVFNFKRSSGVDSTRKQGCAIYIAYENIVIVGTLSSISQNVHTQRVHVYTIWRRLEYCASAFIVHAFTVI